MLTIEQIKEAILADNDQDDDRALIGRALLLVKTMAVCNSRRSCTGQECICAPTCVNDIQAALFQILDKRESKLQEKLLLAEARLKIYEAHADAMNEGSE
jgi:hypothetical protein